VAGYSRLTGADKEGTHARLQHVTAADVSSVMVEKARERLGEVHNASVMVEDAQALSFPGETFDAVVCNLGLIC
jgi:ubiquinone/menaquinone biosynthesis C-methylase UbiE